VLFRRRIETTNNKSGEGYMDEQGDFFTPQQERLYNIATWARYLAWGSLFYYIIRAILVIVQYQVDLQRWQLIAVSPPSVVNLGDLFTFDPIYYSIDMASEMASAILSGAIFYVVLKGIYLGLNMIVETDVNYREVKNQGGNNE
jgi:hypothetical protein